MHSPDTDHAKENKIGLLCKWMPRKGEIFEYFRKHLKLSPKAFRKFLVANTKVVEQQMSAKQWSFIEYEKIPSQAFHKYKKAFMRNDEERFTAFIEKDPLAIKAGTLFPYQLFQSFKKGERQDIIDAQWANLPNYVPEGKSFLPMVDVSLSMNSTY